MGSRWFESAVRCMEARGYRVRIRGGGTNVCIVATDPRCGETYAARALAADAPRAMLELTRLVGVEVGPMRA